MKITILVTCAALLISGNSWASDKIRVGMLARVTGNSAFELAHFGALDAAEELGLELLYMAPGENTAAAQIASLEKMIAQGVEGIMLSANDQTALSPVLKSAAAAGIKIVTYDQDTEESARHLHIASATNELIALAPAKIVHGLVYGSGDIAVIAGQVNSTTQNRWVEELVRLTNEEHQYKGLDLVEIAYGEERYDKSYAEALRLLKTHPNLEAIVAYSSIGLLATAQMVRDQNLIGKIKVTGLGFPNEMLAHVLSGAVPAFAIWDMEDVGYTATYALKALIDGGISGKPEDIVNAGRMGFRLVGEHHIAVMGDLFVYNQSNIKAGVAVARASLR